MMSSSSSSGIRYAQDLQLVQVIKKCTNPNGTLKLLQGQILMVSPGSVDIEGMTVVVLIDTLNDAGQVIHRTKWRLSTRFLCLPGDPDRVPLHKHPFWCNEPSSPMAPSTPPSMTHALASTTFASTSTCEQSSDPVLGARIAELERQLHSSTVHWQQQVQDLQQQIQQLQHDKEELLTSLASKDGALEEERRIKEVMQKEMEEVQTASQQRGSQLAMELQVTLDKEREKHTQELASAVERTRKEAQDEMQERIHAAEAAAEQALAEKESLQSTLGLKIVSLERQCEVAMKQAETMEKSNCALRADRDAQEEEIRFWQQRTLKGEMVRRKLHNTILEMKGNIRVFCRIRPLLEGERPAEFSFPQDTDNQIELLNVPGQPKKLTFAFDRVFRNTVSQADIFEEVSLLVQSALDGYQVCIFAYGVTGSGKTYTMEGENQEIPVDLLEASKTEAEESMAANLRGGIRPALRSLVVGEQSGIIPRSVQQIFNSLDFFREEGWEFTFEASYLEIYCDEIRDLVPEEGAPRKGKLHIKHGQDGSVFVEGITKHVVREPVDVHRLLKQASEQRTSAATRLNAQSSRSHSIFQLEARGIHVESGKETRGMLNLVDLAGSERIKHTGGDRLEETQFINRSLSALGDVIHSLATKSIHIPYRNSKLTKLLAPSLGGNSKTLMFVNISPTAQHASESANSLRFASRVNSVDLNSVASTAAGPSRVRSSGNLSTSNPP